VASVALSLTGCGGRAGPSIVIYNGQHTELTQALVSAFTNATGIAVEMRTNDSLVLADQIIDEGHGSPADVYLSENSPELETLAEHGLLARLPRAILDQVPARDDSPAGDWVGIALRVSALVYDPALNLALAAARVDPRPRAPALQGQGRDRPRSTPTSRRSWGR